MNIFVHTNFQVQFGWNRTTGFVCKLSIMAPANKPHENGKKLNKFKLESQGPANKQVLNLIFNLKLVLLRM